ncbi:hypothetical protein ACNY4O_000118 [Cronobacter sakazakii]|nr:hypothetical protein [Cronobacter sakazakii]ELY3989943.1 hypothetical protein [Cronobacter sakazakii]
MKITKEKFLTVMSGIEDFEVIKSDKKYPDDDNVILVKWKGQALFVAFNDKDIPEQINDDEDVDATVSFDFAISIIELAKKYIGNVDPLIKYKIANYTNIKSDYDSVVVYREDLDVFTIDVKHMALSRTETSNDIMIAFISMVLSGVLTSQLLRKQINAYKKSPEKFLKECTGVK